MKKTGIELVIDELDRHAEKGFDAEHDEQHSAFQLSTAAGCFIANAQNKAFKDHTHNDGTNSARFQIRNFESDRWKEEWPFVDYDGRADSGIIESLVKAAALCIAEINRIQSDES